MQELTIRSESIQRIYSFYIDKKLLVNRRYQRKLVWTIEEKEAFIDSIIKEYPVPLILFAEDNEKDDSVFEIIDGMQRLNAIVSYIENEFSVNGYYFDLESMAETKLLKDMGEIIQKIPILNRKICVDKIASYVLPISSYRSPNSETIDDVFRRINSNGKHLSRQEIRQAGTISLFSESVRKIASEIRGDVSLENRLYLNDMKKISITSKDLNYGINVDNLFWTRNNIINKEQVRESKDEEIIADILAAILSEEMPRSNSKTLDEYYGLYGEDRRAKYIQSRIIIMGTDILHQNFFTVFDEIKVLLNYSGKKFNELISKTRNFDKVPRYFQIIFLAFYDLMIKQNLNIISITEVIKILDGITDNVSLSQGGGNWSAIERENSVNAIVGMLNKCFTENIEDPAKVKWSTELETILKQSEIEQTSFDFKMSFFNIETKQYNKQVLDKAIKTLTAMANRGKNCVGYVIIGIADKEEDAEKLIKIDPKYKAIKQDNFFITGVNFDIDTSRMSSDTFFQNLIQKINSQPIEEQFKTYICNNIRFVKYGDKNVIILKIQSSSKPAIYDEKYYERKGANIYEVPIKNISILFDKFKD